MENKNDYKIKYYIFKDQGKLCKNNELKQIWPNYYTDYRTAMLDDNITQRDNIYRLYILPFKVEIRFFYNSTHFISKRNYISIKLFLYLEIV
jgi:hypothetical protein